MLPIWPSAHGLQLLRLIGNTPGACGKHWDRAPRWQPRRPADVDQIDEMSERSAVATGECVPEGVAPDLAAQQETGLVVQARVEAGVDPAQPGFGRGVVEAGE